MSRHRASEFRYASPEALFMFGGEDESPYYPPDFEEMVEWGVCVPYDRGSAATERMQHAKYFTPSFAANLAIRDALIDQISVRISNAREIETARQKIADAFKSLLETSYVDQQG